MRLTLSNMVFTLLAGVPALSSAQVSTQQTTATPAQSGELQEVVVTATRRSESQLQVPMSISVIGTQQLKDEQIQSFDDYAQQIPNLTFRPDSQRRCRLHRCQNLDGWVGNLPERRRTFAPSRPVDSQFQCSRVPVETRCFSRTPRMLSSRLIACNWVSVP
jgi:hypothetical protein